VTAAPNCVASPAVEFVAEEGGEAQFGAVLSRAARTWRFATIGRARESLFMSPKTASVHVSRILAKLGATNRTEAVAVARIAGLLND
jgi:hypothetical protein